MNNVIRNKIIYMLDSLNSEQIDTIISLIEEYETFLQQVKMEIEEIKEIEFVN